MKIEFDLQKDKTNIEKHGVSLAHAQHIEWETLLATQDRRKDYGEIRMIGYAYIDIRLHCVVYTDKAESRRIISLRKANRREVRDYAKA